MNNHPTHNHLHRCEACGSALQPSTEKAVDSSASGENKPREAHFLYTVNGFNIFACPECGLRWTSVPENFQPETLYEEDFFQGKSPNGYFDYLGCSRVLNDEFIQRASFVHRYQPNGALLDVGCATGNFLKAAQKYFDIKGIDVSSFAIAAALKDNLPVRCGSLLELEQTPASYNVITMFDTLEHVANPSEMVTRAHLLLKKNGVLFITTGDAGSLAARLFGKRWRLMTPPEHLWFFNHNNLAKMLTRCGFSIVDIQYAWRQVPLSLMWFQVFRGRKKPLPALLGNLTLPVNLFDAMTVIARKKDE